MQDNFYKLQESRFLWRLLAIFCLVCWVGRNCNPQFTYSFDPYENLVEINRYQWFHRTKNIAISWRSDSDGELAWCAKDENGRWYRFIDDVDDYSSDED